jgi:hypothetical protein
MSSGTPAARRSESVHSIQRTTVGPIGMRPSVNAPSPGYLLKTRLASIIRSLTCPCHRSGSGVGSSISAKTRSRTSSMRPSLLPTCQYRVAGPVPSSSAIRRMLKPSTPSLSTTSSAA